MIRRRKNETDESVEDFEYESESDESWTSDDTNEDEKTVVDTSALNDGEFKTDNKTTVPYWIILPGLCLVTYFVLIITGSTVSEVDYDKETSMKLLQESMQSMQKEFSKLQPEAWDEIASGIRDVVLNKQKISTFILLASESGTMNCLAASLGNISRIVLHTNEYLTLKPENQGHDTGEVLYGLREQMKQKRVMVVQDFLNINTPTLMAFHYLCDRENPSVERAIYIITIVDSRYKGSQDVFHYVERSINRKLLGTVTEDSIKPLITRITDASVLYIQQEQNMKECLR